MLKISDSQYDNYLQNLASGGEYARSLDDIIIKTLESEIKKLDSVLGEEEGRETKIEVASITYGYKNGDLIRAMKERGALIGSGAFHKVPEKDDLLNTIIENDIEKLKQPVYAFVTFTEQEAYERCEGTFFKELRGGGGPNKDYEPLMLLEEATVVAEAPEPSNVLWENLEVTRL